MLLRLYKKLFNFRVKFEVENSGDITLSDDDEELVIDLGIHIQNIQTRCSPVYIIQEAINNDDQEKLRNLINHWGWDGKTALYPVNDDNIKTVIEFSVKALGNKANLNWIDVSCITNMSSLFANSQFNGDISNWNVSNVTDMSYMFYKNFDFESDINKWDVSNVKDMRCMFAKTYSFDQDISKWKGLMSDVDTTNMFLEARKHKGL